MKLGQKVRLVKAWRQFSVGAVLTQGYEVDLAQLVASGHAVACDDVTDKRPAKLARKAADKIAAGAKGLFGAA